MEKSKIVGLILGPIVFLLLTYLPIELISEKGDPVIAVAVWMLIWWITEAVSISVTALLPLLLFPILKVLPIGEVGANYGSPIVFLFFGGFVMALALEKATSLNDNQKEQQPANGKKKGRKNKGTKILLTGAARPTM